MRKGGQRLCVVEAWFPLGAYDLFHPSRIERTHQPTTYQEAQSKTLQRFGKGNRDGSERSLGRRFQINAACTGTAQIRRVNRPYFKRDVLTAKLNGARCETSHRLARSDEKMSPLGLLGRQPEIFLKSRGCQPQEMST